MTVQEAQDTASELALGVHAGEVRGADATEAGAVRQAARLAPSRARDRSSRPLVRQLIAEDADCASGRIAK